MRYRIHAKGIPGKPDLVFSRTRVVVFCDGDFWHGRDWLRLRRRLQRRHNADYWITKIARNRERDRNVTKLLVQDGWFVVRLWESDILREPQAAAARVRDVVLNRAASPCPFPRECPT